MKPFETEYKNLIHNILDNGTVQENRTGVKAFTIFNHSFNIDLRRGFPIVTGKKIFFEKAYHEYIWMRDGMTTTKYLNANGIHWWDKYAKPNGDLGRTYGYQMRNYNGDFDQLMYCVKEIKQGSRRAHITMWNPSDLEYQSLPCCYTSFNFVRINNTLNMSMEFRSSDVFLGLPYDIVVGALLLHDVARFTELNVGLLGINLSNAHIYSNHLEEVGKYLNSEVYRLPRLTDNKLPKYMLDNYICGPYIKTELNE